MKKNLLILPATLLIIGIAVISCKKNDTASDPNQATIDRLKLAADHRAGYVYSLIHVKPRFDELLKK